MGALYAKYGSGYPVEDFGFLFGVVLVVGYLGGVIG